jgi:hypothetical protein
VSYYASAPGVINTTIPLDAQGSFAAPGSFIDQYVWGVIALPSRAFVTTAAGRVATVSVPQGSYQVGRAGRGG